MKRRGLKETFKIGTNRMQLLPPGGGIGPGGYSIKHYGFIMCAK